MLCATHPNPEAEVAGHPASFRPCDQVNVQGTAAVHVTAQITGTSPDPQERDIVMKKQLTALAFALCLTAGTAFAAAPKTYQVTGPVLEVSDDLIVVQKGKEKWEIARTKDTKVNGDLKVGAKVTIEYRMTAATVEAKPAAPEKPAKPTK
jgi:hypothetical protein